MTAALISGAFATVVAVVAALLSYWFGQRTMAREFENRLEEIGATGSEERKTAEWEYRFEAIKALRTALGGPKSQIIEAAHDLSDRLRGFFTRPDAWGWAESEGGYYRISLSWLLVRPFAWMEILNRRMEYMDRTLGDEIEHELLFLRYCNFLKESITGPALFEGTDYDKAIAEAHVFGGEVQSIGEQFIRTDDGVMSCIAFSEFWADEGDEAAAAAPVLRLISDLSPPGRLRDFRFASLLTVYCATNALLDHFALPFREHESASASLRHAELISEERCEVLRRNIERFLSEADDGRSERDGDASQPFRHP